MVEERSFVAEQFEDAEQQFEAAHLGMWTFLATEILFFGGLFMAYITYRHAYPDGFAAGSRHTDLFYGTFNTVVLLTSSLTMALAVHAAQQDKTKSLVRCLLMTLGFAAAFLVVKGFEYHKDIVEKLLPGPSFLPALAPKAEIFFYLYWAMTGLHACHVLAGVGVLSVITWLARRGRFSRRYHTPVEVAGLYWHFVDIVWIFLYPLLYLIDRHA
ncbi:MAG: cytochrome oxidase subunit III [Verrucomicrobia bacterium]|nr:MAG: cytochrome oxidase subunit III [Verrucomicrobiota bacterium]